MKHLREARLRVRERSAFRLVFCKTQQERGSSALEVGPSAKLLHPKDHRRTKPLSSNIF
jgi:hypothetical protein